jgi:alpha-D-xyloside xylohydrolase
MTKLRGGRSAVVALLALGCAAAPSSACSDASLRLQPEPFVIGEGRFTLRVSGNGSELVLLRDGSPLLTLDPAAFQLGIVDELGTERSWDPWEIERVGELESGVQYRSPIGWLASPATIEDEAQLVLDFGGGITATVRIGVASESRFSFSILPGETGPGRPAVALARMRVHTNGDPREGFYGMGELVDGVDSRGKLRAMQMEADGAVESANNEAHVPVPLLVGTRGWGMFAATPRIGTFDVVRKEPTTIEATFAVAPLKSLVRAEPLRVDLIGGDAPLDLYREYYRAAGAVKLPPPWALGPWIWRNESKDQAEVEDDIAKIRDLDLATSGIWIDRPYATAVNTFDFEASRFPQPRAMIDRARAAGLRVALWSTPYLEEAAQPMAAEAKARGFYPTTAGIPLNDWGLPVDFTTPDATKFWAGLVQRYTNIGIDGFKLDYGEDFVPSLGAKRNVWQMADGSDERTMHFRYSGIYHRAYLEPFGAQTPFLLVRAAHWGEQSLGMIVWPGDLDASFTQHKEKLVTRSGEEVSGVGGLPTSVVMGLSLSASGFPFFAADTGGYRHSPPDKELFVRWVEQTALSTVMEVGDASSQPPWLSTPENGRDAESLDIYRVYARLHLRLFPYEWTHATRMLVDGRPIQRPLGLAFPELGVHPSDEYLFGDDLLVAPILARGQTRRRVIAPSGGWIDFWDGTPITLDASHSFEVDAGLAKLPLFVREGAIVPMLRPTIDTLAEATDPAIESFARDPGLLWALVAPGPARSFDLWDGSRIARRDDGSFDLRGGAVFDKGFVLESIATREPTRVIRDDGEALPRVATPEALEGVALGWAWSAARSGTLVIKLPSGSSRVRAL